MKKLLTLALTAAVAIGGFAASQVSAATIDVLPGESIQDAINSAAPGDVINVAAGTYAGPININKPVTLAGAQAGVDARDRTGAETVITSQYTGGFNVQSTDVTIDGFTIDGAAATAYGRAIVLPVSTDVSNLTVQNNIIKNNQTGLTTAFSATDAAIVNGLMVSNNKFADNSQTGTAAGIFVANATGSNLTIVDNDFSNTDDGSAGSTNAISVSGLPGAPIDDVVIRGNTSVNDGSFAYLYNVTHATIDNNTSDDQAGNGVLIGNGATDITVSNNSLTNSNNGVRFSATAVPASNVTITGNTISGAATAGIQVSDGAIGDNVVVTSNSITNNALGIQNEGTVAVDANLNWWGCEAGPGATGCDATDGIVLASEWYVGDAMTTSNLDADDSVVPGVPNTGWASSFSVYIAIALAAAVALVAVVAYRRRATNW